MDFFNIPEPPSFERVQNDYSQKQIDLLNEIKTVQQDQAKLLNQMEKASSKDNFISNCRYWNYHRNCHSSFLIAATHKYKLVRYYS